MKDASLEQAALLEPMNLAPLITHRFALADYPAALETLMQRQPKALKVLIVHDGDQEGREQ